ncbi:hypothetical protein GLOIN_2v1783204 [Rhizophagus irregularis DAOM 181602=DAOM 197198]|nr:hypothetical protein GLOIN_2v1783204 [Rhizophagus irregularis DAOM 181602=DAOM 197198]
MNRQTFFLSPKFNKKPIYSLQTNKYQEFTNAYVYSIMVKTGNSDPNRSKLCELVTKEWNKIKRKDKPEIDDIIKDYLATPYNLCNIQTMRSIPSGSREKSLPNLSTICTVDPVPEISINVSSQQKTANEIQIAKKKLTETTLNNYLLPHQSNSITAKAHHHLVWIAVAKVSHTETRDHSDGHYCLASVKSARQFATVFANNAVIILQDDKAKIDLGVPAVGRTFHTLQSVNELVNLKNLTLDPKYNDVLKTNEEIRPIWVLLVDGGLDKNPRHLKNIKTYCHFFQKFDLDYLTVQTHASGQSKYNPVERGMATLSGKLASITLPIDHFRLHLNTQGKIENHCNLCQYSLDIKRCTNSSYCGLSYTKEIKDLLLSNNGFLPPTTKAKDGHFTNPIYLLEYYNLLKILRYDSHCPSIDQMTYSRLCCLVCNKYFSTFNYLTKHKKAMHPVSRERPKEKFKCNSNSLDDFSLLPSQQKWPFFDEMNLREYISDNE